MCSFSHISHLGSPISQEYGHPSDQNFRFHCEISHPWWPKVAMGWPISLDTGLKTSWQYSWFYFTWNMRGMAWAKHFIIIVQCVVLASSEYTCIVYVQCKLQCKWLRVVRWLWGSQRTIELRWTAVLTAVLFPRLLCLEWSSLTAVTCLTHYQIFIFKLKRDQPLLLISKMNLTLRTQCKKPH